jgi:hypothetical protein
MLHENHVNPAFKAETVASEAAVEGGAAAVASAFQKACAGDPHCQHTVALSMVSSPELPVAT